MADVAVPSIWPSVAAHVGQLLIEAEIRRAVGVALQTSGPDAIIDARIETQANCCHGCGYVADLSADAAKVRLCPCLKVIIVTRLPGEQK